MSKVQLRSIEGGTYELLIDGKDVAGEVLADVKLEFPMSCDDLPTLTVKYIVTELDVDLDSAEVQGA
jgi:hypothetical protein